MPLVHNLFTKWILSAHLISMVAWFAALFYLPRLFVYHAECPPEDSSGHKRFIIMERRLYRGIMWPAAIATTVFGIWLLTFNWSYYKTAGWMYMKLALVALLWGYHLYCGHIRKIFAAGDNRKSSVFFRFFNEVPTILLIGIIIAAIVQP